MAQAPPPDPERGDEPRRLSDHLLEYVRDPSLWPVLVVATAIFLTLLSALLLLALRQRNGFALAALVVLAGASADAITREWRSGGSRAITIVLGSLWTLALAAAAVALGLGWY